jgi:thiol-disulfide isomerase/thioredoxin
MRLVFIYLLFLTFLSCGDEKKNDNNNFSILTKLNGEKFTLENYKGNVIILNIWATWCKPCIAEFDSLEKIKKKFENKNIKIIAVSNEDLGLIKDFVDKRKFNLEFIKLNGDLSYFDAYSLPTTIVYNKIGDELLRLTGGVDFNTNNFINKIIEIEKL